MRRILVLVSLVFLGFLQSCEEEDPETTILVTEEVLLTSGEQARLLGRLITNQSINPIDHGFYLSLDENFSSPIIISLGPKEGPGRFIGEVTGLDVGQTYFARAYMDLGNGDEFGNTIELATLDPALESFEPNFGEEGAEIFIFGRNFTEDTRVFFGDQEATVTEILFESRLTVIIPSGFTAPSVELRVLVQDEELIFDNTFEYQIGTYQVLPNFPESVRIYGNVNFENSGEFYVGIGTERFATFYDKLFKYNANSSNWSEVPYNGESTYFGFATANYLGGGAREIGREPFLLNRNFYRFNGNSYTQLADLPFDSRESIAFEIGGDLFVVGGREGNQQAGWRYRPGPGAWTQIAEAPFPISQQLGTFTYNGEQYFIDDTGAIVKYNPMSNSWDAAGIFPGRISDGYPVTGVIGDKVYIGAYRRAQEMWEWDLSSRIWTKKNDIPGIPQSINVGYWSQNGFIYFLRVPEVGVAGNAQMSFYQFDPNGL